MHFINQFIRIFVFLTILLTGSLLNAQKNKNTPAETSQHTQQTPEQSMNVEIHTHVFRQALKYNDLSVAKIALYYALAADSNNTDLKDTLAITYFSAGEYEQSILIGKELLLKRPDDIRLLSMIAFSYNQLGATRQALEEYEKIYILNRSPYYLYQVALLQFSMQRFGECMQSVNVLIQDPKSSTSKVSVPVTKQRQQEVTIQAAAYFVQGQIFREQKEIDKAIASYEQALSIEPDFEIPQKLITELKTESKPQD